MRKSHKEFTKRSLIFCEQATIGGKIIFIHNILRDFGFALDVAAKR